MIGNIKKLFLPKNGMWKKQVSKIQGSKVHAAMLHAILQGCTKYPMSKESKEIENSHN